MYSRILVPVDGTATSDAGLREAIELAASMNAHLVVLCIVDDFPLRVTMASVLGVGAARTVQAAQAQDLLAKARQRAASAGVSHEVVLRDITSQHPAEAIVEAASVHGCGLIVMGTHARPGWSRLAMGSISELVLRDSHVPVLLVRSHW